MFDKEPPKSIESEMALLGSMILDPNWINDLGVTAADFYAEKHAAIYTALAAVYDARGDADLAMLVAELDARGVRAQIDDAYLCELTRVPTSVNAPHYAAIVREKATLRRIIDGAATTMHEAYHAADFGPGGLQEIIDRAEMRNFAAVQAAAGDKVTGEESLASILTRDVKRMETAGEPVCVRTRYTDMDRMLGGGLYPGELSVLAARPSMGKTALMLNIAANMAAHDVPVLVLSMEMRRESLVHRLLACEARVDMAELRGGKTITDATLRDVVVATENIKHWPIFVDDTPGMAIATARTKIRRAVQRSGVRVVFVDYLQLMTAPGVRESRQAEVASISRGIKALAQETGVHIMALSQLNRSVEGRSDFTPRMSDLRESGAIEQDADLIFLLHREEYYRKNDEAWKQANGHLIGIAEIIIAKQRNGETGSVDMAWNPGRTRFESLAEGVVVNRNTPKQNKFEERDWTKEGASKEREEPANVRAPEATQEDPF